MEPHLQTIIKTAPKKPGIYQYFDKAGQIIYVGKAKNLKKRIASYFNKDSFENRKIAVLVKKIANIKYIVVDSEFDARLLENNFIKKYQPRYNAQLKDDKNFPWICILKPVFGKLNLAQIPYGLIENSEFVPYSVAVCRYFKGCHRIEKA